MKKILQDIVFSRKKSVKSSVFAKPSSRPPIAKKRQTFDLADFKDSGGKKRNGKLFFIAAFSIFLLIIGVKLVGVFSKVVVTVSLHAEIMPIDVIIKAATDDTGIDMKIETMEFNFSAVKEIEAEGIRFIETKASGLITIYNAYNSTPQILVQNTRFESNSGKIYRIDKTISVPGAVLKEGKTIPGSIQVTIYADEVGEEYNSEPTDFTIPGFADGPRYEKFYGRSNMAITGGFKGDMSFAEEDKLKKAKEDLKKEIADNLTKKAYAHIPAGFMLYEKSISIDFSENQVSQVGSGGERSFVKLSMDGFLHGFLVSEKNLSDFLVKKYLGEDQLEKARVVNASELQFNVVKQDKDAGTLTFRLSGEARFVWLLEEAKLKESLIASQKNVESVFKYYPAIDKAGVSFKPFWWKFFPEKGSKIKIEYVPVI